MTPRITEKYHLPHLGMRIVKTGVAVFFCLLLNYLFSAEVALVSSLAAIVSMQSSLENTMKTAIARAAGTALGGAAGILMLPFGQMVGTSVLYVFLTPLGMIAVIYLCVLFRMPKSVSICAYVYVTVLVAPVGGDLSDAYREGLLRIADTAFGVFVSLLVNRFIAPPRPVPDKDVIVPVNSFSSVYARIQTLLPSPAELVLIDSRLIWPSAKRAQPSIGRAGISPPLTDSDCVTLPVPTIYSKSSSLATVFVELGYAIHEMKLPQKNGYVTIPSEAYPTAIAWHVPQAQGHETYDILHRHAKRKSARILRKSAYTGSAPLYLHPSSPYSVQGGSNV